MHSEQWYKRAKSLTVRLRANKKNAGHGERNEKRQKAGSSPKEDRDPSPQTPRQTKQIRLQDSYNYSFTKGIRQPDRSHSTVNILLVHDADWPLGVRRHRLAVADDDRAFLAGVGGGGHSRGVDGRHRRTRDT
jgi:hypothetical protein